MVFSFKVEYVWIKNTHDLKLETKMITMYKHLFIIENIHN